MSFSPPHVRPAVLADLETIVAFNIAMARETESLEFDEGTVRRGVAAVLGDPSRGSYRVATRDGVIVGQLMLTSEWSDWRCAWWWWIQSVYVVPESRWSGVYRALHTSVLDDATRAGDVHGVRLYVEQDNVRAQTTYESLGMTRGRCVVYESTHE